MMGGRPARVIRMSVLAFSGLRRPLGARMPSRYPRADSCTARHDLWRSGAFDGGPRPAASPTPRGPFAVFLPLMGGC